MSHDHPITIPKAAPAVVTGDPALPARDPSVSMEIWGLFETVATVVHDDTKRPRIGRPRPDPHELTRQWHDAAISTCRCTRSGWATTPELLTQAVSVRHRKPLGVNRTARRGALLEQMVIDQDRRRPSPPSPREIEDALLRNVGFIVGSAHTSA